MPFDCGWGQKAPLHISKHGVNDMLLLTNCEVHTAKYSDHSFHSQCGSNLARSLLLQ